MADLEWSSRGQAEDASLLFSPSVLQLQLLTHSFQREHLDPSEPPHQPPCWIRIR
jgi:hypothetical protein